MSHGLLRPFCARATRTATVSIALALSAVGCQHAAPVDSAGGTRARLAPGESFQPATGDLRVTFERVNSDSRCPTDVVCAWAGNAEISISVSSTSARFSQPSWTINTTLEPRDVVIMGQRLRIEQLDPAPRSTTPVSPAAYRVTLTAVRLPD